MKALAFFSKHNDNEYHINPSSEIFIISPADLAKNGDNTSEINVGHQSMYSMTQSTQNFYGHHIAPNSVNTLGFSITVRWKYLNSLYDKGDSNFGQIKFGEGMCSIDKLARRS